jgi:carbon storage regulator
MGAIRGVAGANATFTKPEPDSQDHSEGKSRVRRAGPVEACNDFAALAPLNGRKSREFAQVLQLTEQNLCLQWMNSLGSSEASPKKQVSQTGNFSEVRTTQVGGVADRIFASVRERLACKGMNMLVLSRKKNESIVINDSISIVVVEIRGDKVRLGVEAPKDVTVHRKEVYDAIKSFDLKHDRLSEGERLFPEGSPTSEGCSDNAG